MPIASREILFAAGGLCLERFGTASLRRAPTNRGGEENKEAFTRAASANAGYYLDRDGILRKAGTDILRPHFLDPLVTGTRKPTLLTEIARTNICLQSENFGTTWVALGTPTRVAAAHTAAGVTLDLLGDDDAAVLEGYQQPITFTGDGTKAVSVCVKRNTAASSVIQLRVVGVVTRLQATLTWSGGGLPVVAMNPGTYYGYVPMADGVFRLLFAAPGVVAADPNQQIQMLPATTASTSVGETGTLYMGGVMIEDAAYPSSYIKTTTASQTRAVDILSFTVPGLQPIQSSCWYWRSVEQGSLFSRGAERGFQMGSGGTNPRILMRTSELADGVRLQLTNLAGAFCQNSYAIAGLTVGDEIEVLLAITVAAGLVNIRVDTARNGGAVTTGAAGVAIALDTPLFSNATLHVGSSDAAGGSAGVFAHRLLSVARGADKTIADFRTYFGL